MDERKTNISELGKVSWALRSTRSEPNALFHLTTNIEPRAGPLEYSTIS
jgi:hypothetical protein